MKRPSGAPSTSKQNMLYELTSLLQEERLTSCSQMVNHLLTTYATDDLVAKADADINNMQPHNLNAVDYSSPCKQRTSAVSIYRKSTDRGHFIEGLHQSI